MFWLGLRFNGDRALARQRLSAEGQDLPKKAHNPDRAADLLEKLLVFQLYASGAPQDRIAKAVGRQKAWVNDLVKGLPKGGRTDGGQAQGKKTEGRPRRR